MNSAERPLSIVVLSHNRLDELSKNIPLLLDGMNCKDEFEIIIADNNSTDGTKEFLQELKSKNDELILVLNKENLGTASGRNAGYVKASGQIILAMDDDARIDIADIYKIPDLFEKHRNAGLLSFRIKHPITCDLENPHGDSICQITHHHGACFAFRKIIFDRTGGIDPICDYGGEEPDFAIKVRSQGYDVLYYPEITVLHNSMIRADKEEERRLERRVYNKIRLFYKYFPPSMARRQANRHLVMSLWGWYRIIGFRNIGRVFQVSRSAKADGLDNKVDIPEDVIKFYQNRKLKPEFGNLPIPLLILDRLYKRFSAFIEKYFIRLSS